MHTLIIKGNEQAAFAACALYECEVTSIVHRTRFDDCIVTVPASVPVSVLQDWYHNDDGVPHPLPAGSLLWYGPAKRDVFDGNLVVPS